MSISIFKYIGITLLSILIYTSDVAAHELYKRPKRRYTTQKQYTSPEEIKARELAADTANTAAADTLSLQPMPEDSAVEAATPQGNSAEQIDSILAMWRATTTIEGYNRYFEEMVMGQNGDAIPTETDARDSLYITRLEALMSPVPLEYNYEVRRAIERFTSPSYSRILGYAYYYFPIIEEELSKAGLPIELRTLAVVESGLNPTAASRMGAKGIWQFMSRTGKEYGLEINSLVDERCNPRRATQAACQYLKNMYDVYGDWTLAIASYNCGPGAVNKAIVRSGGDPRNYDGSFWDVYQRLPSETRSYVPLYMGATYAFAYHKSHGVELTMPATPLAVDTIMINRPMHLEQISSTIDIDIELLKMLNPEYLLSIIPATTKSYPLTLPIEYITEYLKNEERIHAKDSAYLKEYIIHANLEKKRMEAPPASYHTVKKGDTLGAIARRYGRTVKQLMTWNGIKNPNALRIGQRLRVSPI